MTAVVIVLAYLFGFHPFRHLDWKIFLSYRHPHIRQREQRNDEYLPRFREKAGTIVLIMDMLKGSAATLLPIWLPLKIHISKYNFIAC